MVLVKLKKIVVINGNAGVGKDTFVRLCREIYPDISNYSTAEIPKRIMKRYFGWNEEKSDKTRKYLSDLKDMLTEYNDVPYRDIETKLKYDDSSLVFIHCREPEEIEKFRIRMNAIPLLIKNDRITISPSNHADKNVDKYNYAYEISNNGTINELREEAKKFLKLIEAIK